MTDNRHVGRFYISYRTLKGAPLTVAEITSGMTILEAHYHADKHATHYLAVSPKHFREVRYGEVVPEYQLIISSDRSFKFKEIE